MLFYCVNNAESVLEKIREITMNTTLSLLTKNVRGVLAASAAFSVMATAPVYAQEAEESAKAEDYEQIAVVGSRAAPRVGRLRSARNRSLSAR